MAFHVLIIGNSPFCDSACATLRAKGIRVLFVGPPAASRRHQLTKHANRPGTPGCRTEFRAEWVPAVWLM